MSKKRTGEANSGQLRLVYQHAYGPVSAALSFAGNSRKYQQIASPAPVDFQIPASGTNAIKRSRQQLIGLCRLEGDRAQPSALLHRYGEELVGNAEAT